MYSIIFTCCARNSRVMMSKLHRKYISINDNDVYLLNLFRILGGEVRANYH